VEGLADVARPRNLRLMFDASHALAATHKGRQVGNHGDCEVFSFHATKFLNALEGGAVVTNDDALANKLRLMRNFGFAGLDHVIGVGTNGKMNEVSAAMGLTSLESTDEFIEINRRNYRAYRQYLSDLPGIRLLPYNEREKANYQYIVLEIDAAKAGLTRDELVRVLWAENVIARRYFWPGCHRSEPYASLLPHAGLLLPVTESVASRVLLLPTGTALSEQMVMEVCTIVRAALDYCQFIAGRLREPVDDHDERPLARGIGPAASRCE